MSSTNLIILAAVVGVVILGLMVRRSMSQRHHSPTAAPDVDAPEKSEQFKPFHIISSQFSDHPLLDFLGQRGLFDTDDHRNVLMLPVKQELATELGISVYSDTPLPAYIEGLRGQLDKIWESADSDAARTGDTKATQRVADKVKGLCDTLKAGLVNGDLIVDVKEP